MLVLSKGAIKDKTEIFRFRTGDEKVIADFDGEMGDRFYALMATKQHRLSFFGVDFQTVVSKPVIE